MAEPTAPAKKSKPIPPLYYGIGAAVLAVGFLLYRRSSTSKSAAAAQQAATAQTASMTPVAAGSYGNANDISSLLPYLNAAGNAGTSTTSGVQATPTTGEQLSGAGYGNPSGPTGPITDMQGHMYSLLTSNGQFNALASQGKTAFLQITPGTFIPTTPNQPLPGGTPLYMQTS